MSFFVNTFLSFKKLFYLKYYILSCFFVTLIV
uniref:Uncharacterized protein n=1 Tax=Firmicutes phage HS16 TaxID=3056394 RepID=A0AA49X3C1_9VIRU|nr:MAG: hypothetical protein [Firmicutes phage HS16]